MKVVVASAERPGRRNRLMDALAHNPNVHNPLELERYSRDIVQEFLRELSQLPARETIGPSRNDDEAVRVEWDGSVEKPVRGTLNKGRWTIHLCPERLQGIPLLALQGWLDIEVAERIVESQPASNHFNFMKQILPLFPVSGAGVSFIRGLVEHLHLGLRRHLATKLIIDTKRGASQAHFYHYKMGQSIEKEEDYRETIPHTWVRAYFLCRKLREYMAISLLMRHHASLVKDIRDSWIEKENYLRGDQQLLDELFHVAEQSRDELYAYKLTEMFKKVRASLLAPSSQATSTGVLH